MLVFLLIILLIIIDYFIIDVFVDLPIQSFGKQQVCFGKKNSAENIYLLIVVVVFLKFSNDSFRVLKYIFIHADLQMDACHVRSDRC